MERQGEGRQQRDIAAAGLERGLPGSEAVVAGAVQDQIERGGGRLHSGLGVIQHGFRAQFPAKVDVAGAADGGDPSAQEAAYLHGIMADTARRANDQDRLPRLQPTLVAQRLEGGHAGEGQAGESFQRQSGRNAGGMTLVNHQAFRRRAQPPDRQHAVDLVTHGELAAIGAGLLDDTGEVKTGRGGKAQGFDPAQHARVQFPVDGVDRRGPHPHPDLTGGWVWLGNFGQLQFVGSAIGGELHGLHAGLRQAYKRRIRLQFRVGAIAERAIPAVLAATEISLAGLLRRVFQGGHAGALMAAIAKGLLAAFAAGAPVVFLAGFDLDGIGGFLRGNGSGHVRRSRLVSGWSVQGLISR